MLGGLLGGVFSEEAKESMDPNDRRNMRASLITNMINKIDTSGLGQTNAILGVYGKPTIEKGGGMRDLAADISATNLAREKQTEDDARKKEYDAAITGALTRRDKTAPILAEILSGISAIGRR